jgi:DNA-directed RNA polymerase subunit M/transcription elongation factor TFIIS
MRNCSKCGDEFIVKGRVNRCNKCERERKAKELAVRRLDPVYEEKYLAQKRATSSKVRHKLKNLIIKEYGGKCECCGEVTPEFLGVDHTKGDGASHRKAIGKQCGPDFYRWLRANGYPKEGFRLLCWNCNLSRGFYGYCPHERDNLNLRHNG